MADAFTAGVKPGGLTNNTQIRILLCYLVKTAGPVTRETMEGALLQDQLVNYFEFADALSELLRQKLIEDSGKGYTVTEKGATVADTLAKNHINIRALSLADTAEFGILRLIVDQPEKGREVLANEGIVVRLTNVLALSAQDAPGGALGALRVLAESGINVEYMYAYVAKVSGKAIMIVQVEDMEVAEEILRRHGFDEADFAGFGD